LRGGAIAQVADPGEDGEVDDGADGGEDEHGNTDGILMEALGWGVDTTDGGERGKSDGQTDAADDKDSGAQALQKGHGKADATDGAESSGNLRSVCLQLRTSPDLNAQGRFRTEIRVSYAGMGGQLRGCRSKMQGRINPTCELMRTGCKRSTRKRIVPKGTNQAVTFFPGFDS
jgi:hypothetical protein